jgi:predicted NBD/HSP70 family sugar kinase
MPTTPADKHDQVRRNNLSRILRHLHATGSASRSDLVGLTGLNRSTIGAIVTDLVDAGLVEERAGTTSTVGRPSLVVAPVATSAVVLSFELRVEKLIGALIGLGGEVLLRLERPHMRADYDVNIAVEEIVQMSISLIEHVQEGSAWVGTGISIPGSVDSAVGRVRLAPNLGWENVALGESLMGAMAAQFGDPPMVTIRNDSDLGAMSEHLRGAAAGAANMIYISGEIGIGGGVVVNNRLLDGVGGYAGEVGHMVIDPSGPECRCGSFGCWETLIGLDSVIRSTGNNPESTELDEILRQAGQHQPQALAGLSDVGRSIGIGISNLVNIFNPEAVVLGGHLRELLPFVEQSVSEMIARALPASRAGVRVVPASIANGSSLVGAAEAGFEELLSDPIGVMDSSSVLVAS